MQIPLFLLLPHSQGTRMTIDTLSSSSDCNDLILHLHFHSLPTRARVTTTLCHLSCALAFFPEGIMWLSMASGEHMVPLSHSLRLKAHHFGRYPRSCSRLSTTLDTHPQTFTPVSIPINVLLNENVSLLP